MTHVRRRINMAQDEAEFRIYAATSPAVRGIVQRSGWREALTTAGAFAFRQLTEDAHLRPERGPLVVVAPIRRARRGADRKTTDAGFRELEQAAYEASQRADPLLRLYARRSNMTGQLPGQLAHIEVTRAAGVRGDRRGLVVRRSPRTS